MSILKRNQAKIRNSNHHAAEYRGYRSGEFIKSHSRFNPAVREITDTIKAINCHPELNECIFVHEGFRFLVNPEEVKSEDLRAFFIKLEKLMCEHLSDYAPRDNSVYRILSNMAGYQILVFERDQRGPVFSGLHNDEKDWWITYANRVD